MNSYHLAILRAIEEIRDSEQDFETAHRGVVNALATLIAVTPADEAASRACLARNLLLHISWRLYEAGRDSRCLAEFPAQELVANPADEIINWQERWSNEGGNIFAGRMIALKSDPIWERISEFNYPFPPFVPGSSVTVSPVARDDAVELVLMDQDAVVELRAIERPTQVI